MSNILISVDSTSDVPVSYKEKYNIHVFPLYINLGDDSLKDGVDVTPEDIYRHVSEGGAFPKTAAIPPVIFTEFFENASKKYDAVIHFSISAGFSSSYQNAYLASQDFENVYVVDTKNLSTGEALLIIKACELAEQGFGVREILSIVDSYIEKVDCSFVIETLDYLYKGGRCNALVTLGANLLQLKPTIEVKNGLMEVGKKYRGKYRTIVAKYINDRLSGVDIADNRVILNRAMCEKEYVDIAKDILKDTGLEVIDAEAGCTIFSHCGPNTICICFVRK